MEKLPLSLCMIVKNEAKQIEKCLESANFFQEIIIVDTGSEDNTVELCKKFTDKVYQETFEPWSFAKARNSSLEKATLDYVFILDGDEYLDENAYDVLKKEFLDKEGDHPTYFLYLVNCFTGGRKSCIHHPRIFKKEGFSYDADIHNQPQMKPPAKYLKINLYHVGYNSAEIGDKLMKKSQRTADMLEAELKKDPDSIRDMYHLTKSYNQLGRFGETIKLSQKIFDRYFNKLDGEQRDDENNKRMVVELMGYFYPAACLRANQRDKYMQDAKITMKLFPNCVDVYYNACVIAVEAGMWEELDLYADSFKVCLKRFEADLVEPYWKLVELQHLWDLAHIEHFLGMKYEVQGHLQNALDQYRKALSINVDYDEPGKKLVEVTLRMSEAEYHNICNEVKQVATNGEQIVGEIQKHVQEKIQKAG